MKTRLFSILMIVLSFSIIFSAYGSQQDIENIILSLDEQVSSASNAKEKAKLCCYRARNYFQIDDVKEAEQSYLEALEYDFSGWILNEYSHFLFKQGAYERAYRAATKVMADFPQFAKNAEKMRKQAAIKYREEYYGENPPTIIMDSKVDRNRETRHTIAKKNGNRKKYRVYSNKSATRSTPSTSSSKAVKTVRS